MIWALVAAEVVCGSPADIPPLPQTHTDLVVERNYKAGEAVTAVVGQTVVRAKSLYVTTSYSWSWVTDRDVTITSQKFTLFLPAGSKLKSMDRRRSASGAVVEIAAARQYSDRTIAALQLDGAGCVADHYAFTLRNGAWREHKNPTLFTPEKPKLTRQLVATKASVPGTLNYEIIYVGQDGPSIRFEYREYTADDLARPAFSQTLAYPKGAQRFRFRDVAFQVLSLKDDEITVRITPSEGD